MWSRNPLVQATLTIMPTTGMRLLAVGHTCGVRYQRDVASVLHCPPQASHHASNVTMTQLALNGMHISICSKTGVGDTVCQQLLCV